MQYIHVKNIEKYNPGHTDRQHIWAKIYYKAFLNENFQELSEIDRYRFWSLIVFETYRQKPVALTRINLALLGWDTKKRPISKTLQMLHTVVEVRGENVAEPERRVEESRVEESRVDNVFSHFLLKTKKKFRLTAERRRIIEKCFRDGRTEEEMKKAIDNFANDDWPDRHKYIDIVYVLGVRNSVNNLDKWLSKEPKKYGPPKLKPLG